MITVERTPEVDRRAAQIQKLDAQALALNRGGDAMQALAVARRAVSQWQELVKEEERFTPKLARSLSVLGRWARQADQPNEALAVTIEAVRHWKKLADQDLDTYGMELYRAQRALAPLATRRNRRDFFGINEEAARLLLRMLPRDEAQYLLPAAQVCHVLAQTGGQYGFPQKGREYAEKSVELWRRLAKQDLIKHGPGLILALKQLSRERIDDQGRWYKPALRQARKVQLARQFRIVLTVLRTGRLRPAQ